MKKQLLFLLQCFLIFSWDKHWPVILGVMQKYELRISFNPLSANSIKWSNTLKQFICWCQQIIWVCVTIYHFVGLVLKGLEGEFDTQG